MKSELLCLQCMIKQSLNTARIASDSPALHREVMNRVAALIPAADLNQTPALLSTPLYSIVKEVTGNPDPYYQIKRQTNREALALIPDLEKLIAESSHPLATALHIAVAGNIIDLGIGHDFDIASDIKALLDLPFSINHEAAFRKHLKPGTKLLYLGDNSGEIVFDRLLIDHLLTYGIHITYVVKSGPIINDVLMEDAIECGITARVPVIETGSDDIGVNFDRAGDEFLEAFKTADVILGKGHGNFESCEHRPENLFFLLKAKCPVVAGALGVRQGDLVFKSATAG